jgi:hypothetical protein
MCECMSLKWSSLKKNVFGFKTMIFSLSIGFEWGFNSKCLIMNSYAKWYRSSFWHNYPHSKHSIFLIKVTGCIVLTVNTFLI